MGLGAAIGGVVSGALSAHAADKATKRQIAWERERATHAHQWEVQDLKAAGLNPILSAGGSGAVTGGIGAPIPDFSGIAGIAGDLAQTSQATTAKKAQKAQQKLQQAQVDQAEAQTENLEVQNEILHAQARAENANSATTVLKNKREQQYLNTWYGKLADRTGRIFSDVGGAITGAIVGGTVRGVVSAGKAAKAAKAAQNAKKINPKTIEKAQSFTLGSDGRLHANW